MIEDRGRGAGKGWKGGRLENGSDSGVKRLPPEERKEVEEEGGELIGLLLDQPVPAGLSPEKTVEEIKAQDGLVLLLHGFDPLKRWRLNPQARESSQESIDIVETFNARVSRKRWNQAAVRWSQANEVLMSAGSDAHTLKDIGAAWCEVPQKSIQSPQDLDLLAALEGGVSVGQWTHPVIAYLLKVLYRLRQKI